MDAFPVDSPWHCISGSGYTPGAGPNPTTKVITGDSALSWGGAGMAGWGSTCGIALGCAQFAEFALPRTSTNGVIDKIFAHFAEGAHPFNAEWFVTGKTPPRSQNLVDFTIKYGSLQCHNVVVQHLNNNDITDCGLADARGEFCGTLVGAICYETMKQVGAIRGGFTPPPSTGFSQKRAGCSATGCHTATGGATGSLSLPSTYLPKEDCYACHK